MSNGDKLFIGFILVFSAMLFFAHISSPALVASGTGHRLLPDHSISPGWVNPDITQANIGQTICNPKWSTKSIRPSSSYTSSLKEYQLGISGIYKVPKGAVFASYIPRDDINNISQIQTADYEEDHIISLELGGHPTDPRNLWPEAYPEARDKDKTENYLHAQVCNGTMTLAEAQKEIAGDWTKVMMQKSGMVFGSVGISESDD